MSILLPDDLEAFAISVLKVYDGPTYDRPHSQMAVHPADFLDESGLHDYELLISCPANLTELAEGEQLDWAMGVSRQARTNLLRDYDPVLLLSMLHAD